MRKNVTIDMEKDESGSYGKVVAVGVGAGAMVLPMLSHAAVDYTSLTTAADFGGLGTAVVGVIVALIGASLLIAGGLAIWKMSKRGSNVG